MRGDEGKMGSFQRFAGISAVAAGIGGPLYSIAFVVLVVLGINPGLGLPMSALLLMLGAILTTAVMVALYQLLRETDDRGLRTDDCCWANPDVAS